MYICNTFILYVSIYTDASDVGNVNTKDALTVAENLMS